MGRWCMVFLLAFVLGAVHGLNAQGALSLPYYHDFEGDSVGVWSPLPEGWMRVNNTTDPGVAGPYVVRDFAGARSGSRSLCFHLPASATHSGYACAALPPLDTAHALRRVRIDFWAMGDTGDARLYVLLLPDSLPSADVVVVDSFSLSPYYRQYTAGFADDTGTGLRVAFGVRFGPGPVRCFLDDLAVTERPACPAPSGLAATLVDGHSALLSWRGCNGGAPRYEVAWGRGPSFAADSAAGDTVVRDTSVVLSGLEGFTTYRWAVRALCGADTGAWSDTQLFRTPRDCGRGFLNHVDTLGNGDAGYFPLPFGTGLLSDTAFSHHIIPSGALDSLGVSADNRLGGIALHCGDTGGIIHNAVVYLAETDLDAFGPSPSATGAWRQGLPVYRGDIVCRPNQWVEIPFDTAFPFAGGRNLRITLSRHGLPSAPVAFRHSSVPYALSCQGGGAGDTLAADTAACRAALPDFVLDFCAALPRCTAPSDVALRCLTHDSMAFAWHGEAEGYETVLGPAGFDPDTTAGGMHFFTTEGHVAFGGLTANTVYDFYVRSLCDEGDTEGWTPLQNLTTACTPVPLPFAEGFEDYGIGPAITLDPCWKKGTNLATAYPFPYPSNAISGSRSLYFYATRTTTATTYSYVALPLLAGAVDSLQMSFKVRRYGSTSASATTRLVVGLMTNPCDIATFAPVDTVDMREDAPLSVRSVEVSFAGHASSGRYIALYDESPTPIPGVSTLYSYAYVDDILVDYIPHCPTPTGIVTADSGITATTAQVAWDTLGGNTEGYEVEYGPEGFAHGMGIRVRTPAGGTILTGLAPGTSYDLYVRIVCSPTDTGDWSPASRFTTAQIPDTVPLFYDFEDSTQWASWQSVSNATAAWYCGTAPYSGTGHALFISADQGYSIDTSLQGAVNACAYRDIDFGTVPHRYNLSFNINVGGSAGLPADSAGLEHDGVAVMLVGSTARVQPAGFPHTTPWGGVDDLSLTIVRNTGGWQHISLPIDSLTGVWRLVFCWFSQPDSLSPFSGQAPAIDSIGIDYYIPCPPPVVDRVGSTHECIDLGWMGQADTYDVAITTGEWSTSIEPVATLSDTLGYRFCGLAPSTAYTVGVRQHCTEADTSVWTTVTVATNSLHCTPVASLSVSDITLHSVTVDWECTGMERLWDVHIWTLEGDDTLHRTGTHPVALDGLESGIRYSCTVRPLCGSTLQEGDWCDTVSFVTSDCPTVTGIMAEDVTTNRVTLSWNASPLVLGWMIEYGNAGFSQGTGTMARATTNSLVINGLECASEYDFYVMAQCDTDLSSLNWGFVSATTAACPEGCNTPTGITTTIYHNNVMVEWTPSEGNNSYEVEYGVRGFQHGTGTILLTNEPFTSINGLQAGIQYDLYVRAVCSAGSHSEWTPVHTFTTGTESITNACEASCTIYPNPASDCATIRMDGTSVIVRIDVMDISGRILQSVTPPCSNNAAVTLDLAGMNKGTCFVRIITDTHSIVKRLVILPQF